MMNMFFAGLWPLIWHMSGATLIVVVCLAWAWFMPVFRKTALEVALVVVLTTTAYVVGVKDGAHRIQSQWDQAIQNERIAVDKAIRDSDSICGTPECVSNDPNNRAHR